MSQIIKFCSAWTKSFPKKIRIFQTECASILTSHKALAAKNIILQQTNRILYIHNRIDLRLSFLSILCILKAFTKQNK